MTRQAERELQRGIEEAATLVDEYRKFSFETFGREARLIADLPVLKAAVDTGDPATRRADRAASTRASSRTRTCSRLPTTQGRILARLGTSDVPDEALAAAATIGGRPPARSARPSGRSGTASC